MEYLRLVAGADDETLRFLVREVNRIHASVRRPEGPEGRPTGRRRPVFDSASQCWVAATWFRSMIDTYELFVSPIDDDVREQLLIEFARVGGLLQMDVSNWPGSCAEFDEYVRAGESRYPVRLPRSAPDASPAEVLPGDVAAQVFSTHSMPWRYLRWAPRIRLLTWGMAGPELRDVYEQEWTDRHQAEFERQVRKLGRTVSMWPGPLRRMSGRRQRRRAASRLQGTRSSRTAR
ncbi:oxygenase MpaB family protein [Gordonia iterans]